jgi:hypothetical protein
MSSMKRPGVPALPEPLREERDQARGGENGGHGAADGHRVSPEKLRAAITSIWLMRGVSIVAAGVVHTW